MRLTLSRSRDIWWIIALCMAVFLAMWHFSRTMYIHDDTETYLDDTQALFSLGIPGYFRTPGYLCIIKLSYLLPGLWHRYVLGLQIAVFFASVWAIWRTAAMLGLGRIASNIVAIVYGALPHITIYNLFVVAESLCISSTVFLVYCCVAYSHRPRPAYVVASCLISVWLMLLKPVFIFLVVLMPLFWWLMLRHRPQVRRLVAIPVIMAVIMTAAAISYKDWMTRTYGLHTLTAATVLNNWFLAYEGSVASPSDAPTAADADTMFHSDGRLRWIYDASFTSCERVVNAAIAAHPDRVAREWMARIPRFGADYAMVQGRDHHRIIPFARRYMPLRLWVLYVIMALYAVAWIRPASRRIMRRTAPAALIIPAIAAAFYATSIVGAMDDWGRLMAPSFSCFILMATLASHSLFRKC